MRVVINGIQIRGSDDAEIIFSANQEVRKEAYGYAPRSLSTACGVHHCKLYHWQEGRLILLTDELRDICKSLDVEFKIKKNK